MFTGISRLRYPPPSTEIDDLIPRSGNTPLPTINSTSYQTINDDPKDDKLFEKKPTINWEVVEPLLKKAQKETGRQFTAVYGVRKNKSYQYQVTSLQFSDQALKEADGKLRPYFFQSYSDIHSPREILAAYIPDSKQAVAEMKTWILSKVPSEAVSKSRSDLQSPGKSSGNQISADCFVPDYTYMMGHTMVIVGHTEPCITASPDGGSGGGGASDGSSGGDVNCHKQLVPTEECPGTSDGQCPPPNLCGGTGGGGDGEISISFSGEIDASDLANHHKGNCIYEKLSQTHTMEEVVSAFAGKSTNFDLDIVVGNVDGGYGTLNSNSSSSTFTMKLDKEGILQRSPIETAVTFMHEAIHAEMRRYLYGATDTSSLPGFPGDFTHDWKLYVKELYGNNVEPAEHEAMTVKYRDIIVNSLKEYDNDELTIDEYRALAWHGLSNTRYYKDVLSHQEKQAIVDNRESALNKTTDTCN